ncbi:MAG: glycosyltransferase family 4 protein [Bacteroidetes bacterium]|nr:glycosyltransferase family 4 protein [Bacteroidota bacterium]
MKILFLCNKLPYPPDEGGSMAMNMMIEGIMQAGHQVKVLAVSSNKYLFNPSAIPENFLTKTRLETVFIDLSPRFLPALYCFFTRKSYHVHRFISKDFEQKLLQILQDQKFDIIQVETIFLTPYLKTIAKYSKAKVFLRAHNIEHLIWKRLAEYTKNPFRKIYLDHLSVQLKNYEIDHLDKYDGIVCISNVDAEYYMNLTQEPVITASFGINAEEYPISQVKEEEPSLFFIGAMNWMPNAEGLKWFLSDVWPAVRKVFPELRFYIACKVIPAWLMAFESSNVKLLGEVENAKNFISSRSIMIVPLHSGSGIRIKIIEGMALGKAVISTSIGAEGIDYENGKNILIADTKDEFVNQIRKCLADDNFLVQLGIEARKTITTNHNANTIIKDLLSFYQKYLNI